MTFTVMNWTKVSFYPRSYQTKVGSVWLWFLFCSGVSWNQRRVETPQFVTTKIDIRGLHSAEGHYNLQYSELYYTSFKITNWIDYLITTIILSLTMSTNGSLPKTTKMGSTGGLFGSQQCPADNMGTSDDNAWNTPSNDTKVGQPTNQFHPPPPPGYSYLPSQPPFPGAPQFYHQAAFNMTFSSQPSSGATQGYPSYGSSSQAYDFPQGWYGGAQMFPPQQFTGHGPSSPGRRWVHPAPPGHNPVIRLTSSTSTAPGQHPSAPGRPVISLRTKQFLLAAEPPRTDVAGIADLPPLADISDDEYNADYESDDLSYLGGAKGKAPGSLKQMEFSLKQCVKGMWQPNFSTFNKWKKVWVAGFLEKKHQSIFRGQNRLRQLYDGH